MSDKPSQIRLCLPGEEWVLCGNYAIPKTVYQRACSIPGLNDNQRDSVAFALAESREVGWQLGVAAYSKSALDMLYKRHGLDVDGSEASTHKGTEEILERLRHVARTAGALVADCEGCQYHPHTTFREAYASLEEGDLGE